MGLKYAKNMDLAAGELNLRATTKKVVSLFFRQSAPSQLLCPHPLILNL